MKTGMRYPSFIAGCLALTFGLNACFGPTSKITYRRDQDTVHTTATATFKLKPAYVYRTVLHVLESAGDVVITSRDDAARTVTAAKNFQNIRIDVRPAGNSSQVTITSDPGPTVSPNTDEALVTMQEICSELGAPCRMPYQ